MKSGMSLKNVLVLLAALILITPWVSAGTSRTVGPETRATDSATYKAWLQKQVRHQLLMLPYFSVFDNLEYTIDGDKVILSGQVVHATLRSDAERAVRNLEGVSAVVNHIEILPASFNDDRIRRAVYRSIYRNTVLQRYALGTNPSIHIIVNRGHVTLEGVVDREMDRNVAYIQANSVPGAFSVTNNLQVGKT